MINNKQVVELSHELIDWFKEKGCDPADGSMIMLKLIANQLVAKTTDIAKLDKALKNVHLVLVCEVALCVKGEQ